MPDLTCSYSGSTSISYSLSSYGAYLAPPWVSIDSNTGKLTITTQDVTADSTFNFYIHSTIGTTKNLIKKKIELIVSSFAVQHCTKCSVSSKSECSICDSGYILSSGL